MARILHLSDLHLQTQLRAETVLAQLCSDLKGELGITILDAIVVTGDSSERAEPSEYAAAATFLKALCDAMHMPRENVLLVPGNHDVHWPTGSASYTVHRAGQEPAASASQYQSPTNPGYIEVVGDEAAYERRFANFAQYYRDVTGREYSLQYGLQFDVVTSADNSVVLMGLNSAWHLDQYFPGRSAIEVGALNRALAMAKERAEALGPRVRVVAAWHHPPRGDDALKDTSFFERLAVDDVVAVLHGHVHKPASEQFNYEWSVAGRRVFFLGAGTLDSPDVHRGYPWHYSIISLDENRLEVSSRGKAERDGAWRPDARYLVGRGKAPVSTLRLELPPATSTVREGESDRGATGERVPPLRSVAELKKHLDAQHFDATGYRIAVEGLIFDSGGRLLMQERGPECRDEVGKLECLGGQVAGDDLQHSLAQHVQSRVGKDVRIEVDELLDVQPTRYLERQGPEDWVVVSYLCRLVAGEPVALDPGKTAKLHWIDLADLHAIPDETLSRSTSRARDVYRIKFRANPYFVVRAGG